MPSVPGSASHWRPDAPASFGDDAVVVASLSCDAFSPDAPASFGDDAVVVASLSCDAFSVDRVPAAFGDDAVAWLAGWLPTPCV